MIVLRLLLLNILLLSSVFILWPSHPYLLAIISISLLILMFSTLYREHRQRLQTINTLKDGLLNLLDSNFSISLDEHKHGGEIVAIFNQVADKLRHERQHIYQRELMLDKVVNQSNILTILVNNSGIVVFANHAAQHFFSGQQSLVGQNWLSVLKDKAPDFYQSLQHQGSAICSFVDKQHHTQSWHLSGSPLQLHGAHHQLYLLKPITEELSRQELDTWKKAIKVISHELNNSIAPISSLCHSGKLLAEQQHSANLDRVFSGISRRIHHLSEFVKGYGQLARIGQPKLESVKLKPLLEGIQTLYDFKFTDDNDTCVIQGDKTQLEQALLNLIKNAIEASPPEMPVLVSLKQRKHSVLINIDDNGSGISEDILHQVMLPYYTTKPQGTGIGLAICRNIIDSHQGRLILKNRQNGGLRASIELPC